MDGKKVLEVIVKEIKNRKPAITKIELVLTKKSIVDMQIGTIHYRQTENGNKKSLESDVLYTDGRIKSPDVPFDLKNKKTIVVHNVQKIRVVEFNIIVGNVYHLLQKEMLSTTCTLDAVIFVRDKELIKELIERIRILTKLTDYKIVMNKFNE